MNNSTFRTLVYAGVFARVRPRINILVAFLFLPVALLAQTSLDRPRTYDVQNYSIRVSFDVAKKRVFGDTTIRLTPLKAAITVVELDAVDLAFTAVTLEPSGKPLRYKVGEGKITVQLDHSYAPGDVTSLRFKYTITAPKKGIYFIPAETSSEKMIHPAQIWTQNEPEDGRYWFPGFDYPSDKATSEEFITVTKGETVIGNGELIETKPNPDGSQTFHYIIDVPHSTYLTSFVVGDFTRIMDSHGPVPLAFYAYKDRENVARIAFSKTKDVMAVYESLTGVSYPYKKYDQVMVSGFQEFDGMENITATTLADSEILFADYAFGLPLVEDLVSHELAHSWFGNLVTCRNWSELWLNEGFATYMEAASRERLYGRESYIRKLKEDRDEYIADDGMKKHHALQNRSARVDSSLFDVTTYQKGGVVLHMLRETVGDMAFWKAINIYLDRHRFDNVVSSDLEAAMDEASGQDLKWFFDQWVYAAGYPKLEITQDYNAAAGELRLTIDQLQKDDGLTPVAFRFPLEIEVATSAGPVTQKLDITKRSETFTVKVPAAPNGLTVDKAEKIMLKAVKIK